MSLRVAVSAPEARVQTACPLDCPDSCSLSVGLRDGRVVEIDGTDVNPVTGGFICAKVRRFGERVYGERRLTFPMVRSGPKGSGRFVRVTWDEALDTVATRLRDIARNDGGEAILPLSYGGSNGLLTQDNLDALLFRRLGASRLARTVCAAPTGAANLALYGKMASVSYLDYPDAKLLVFWGQNPSVSGIHAVPFVRQARKHGARLVVIDPRRTAIAREADLHLAVRPGTDLPVALAVHRHLFESGAADLAFLAAHATGVDALRERAAAWTIERAASVAGIAPDDLARFAELFATTSPALIRCGWGLERNRNGGSAAFAVLALPAVGGKFGVRGGGYAMSNSASWNLQRPWLTTAEPGTRVVNMNHVGRVLTGDAAPPVRALFVYNCNPVATLPDQQRVLAGLAREDLFTVVFEQVMTDTAEYADVLLPATTFLEGYDLAKAYGSLSLQLARSVIGPVGEARPNADVFGELLQRTGLSEEGEPAGELDMLVAALGSLPPQFSEGLNATGVANPPWNGRPVQFGDVFPLTPDGRVHLCPEDIDRQAPRGLYGFADDPATAAHPLALITPSSDRTISSTLGELPRPRVRLQMHPDDARARGLEDGDDVRVFNELGEVLCPVEVTPVVRPGTVSLPKGLWRKDTANGNTPNTLTPDTLTDVAGGACFNDARVQIERAE